MYNNYLKRLFDIIFSIILIVILIPIYLFVSFLIVFDSGFPIFYKWRVVGKDGVFFKAYKFRTMIINADKVKKNLLNKNEMQGPFFKMKNDPRITRLGNFLRKYSLDELPQFFSVLYGDMSIVGPRPPLQSEWKEFSKYQKSKLQVKPGITCLWQIGGRNEINDANEWVKKDLEYIQNISFRLDCYIIYKTIFKIFEGTGR